MLCRSRRHFGGGTRAFAAAVVLRGWSVRLRRCGRHTRGGRGRGAGYLRRPRVRLEPLTQRRRGDGAARRIAPSCTRTITKAHTRRTGGGGGGGARRSTHDRPHPSLRSVRETADWARGRWWRGTGAGHVPAAAQTAWLPADGTPGWGRPSGLVMPRSCDSATAAVGV